MVVEHHDHQGRFCTYLDLHVSMGNFVSTNWDLHSPPRAGHDTHVKHFPVCTQYPKYSFVCTY